MQMSWANDSISEADLSIILEWSIKWLERRDIQKWEYVPLGPLLKKLCLFYFNSDFVTMDALEPSSSSKTKS
jgi:hypothetical protein